MPTPKSSTPALLLMSVRSRRAARVQRRDEVFGNAAQTEAAHHDRRAVGDQRDGLVGARAAPCSCSRLYRRSRINAVAPVARRRRKLARAASPSARSARSCREHAHERVERGADLRRRWWRRCRARCRRGSRRAASCRRARARPAPAVPPTCAANDLHQRARGELRKMTENTRADDRARRPR